MKEPARSDALPPAIKWSGSKRPIAGRLHALWPAASDPGATYYEPFVGGGAMLPGRPLRRAVAGDVVAPLVGLWRAIAEHPAEAADWYRRHWLDRQTRGAVVYDEVRDRFNAQGSPLDLLVLSRMCVNGLIRFNRDGAFNNSLHHTRPGVHPDRLEALLHRWSAALDGVRFQAADFAETLAPARAGDRVFLDPPYVGNKGRYAPGDFDFPRLWEVLEALNLRGVGWILTLDGSAGERAYAQAVPPELISLRLELPTGHSPFTRLMGRSLDEVREAVYLGRALPRPAGV